MKKCPKCNEKIRYRDLLFLNRYKRLICKQCGSVLSINILKMLPFAIIVVVLGFLFGMTYYSTGMSTRWLKILISYFALVFFISPFIIQLKIDKIGKPKTSGNKGGNKGVSTL